MSYFVQRERFSFVNRLNRIYDNMLNYVFSVFPIYLSKWDLKTIARFKLKQLSIANLTNEMMLWIVKQGSY